MKGVGKHTLSALLAKLARGIIRTYRPQIVMVTGSVGKTSTKDAVIAAFSRHTNVRGSEKSFNSEIGVPLTIIGAKNPWENPWRWLIVLFKGFWLLLGRAAYPKLLVLEVGADRPGDLERILRIATPDAVVVTRLPDVPVHVEAYASTDAVKSEEFTPAFALAAGAPLILASDNEYALSMGKKTLARMVTFGFAPESAVAITAPAVHAEKGNVLGMEGNLVANGKVHPVLVRGALGAHQLLAPSAAFACAQALGVPVQKILQGLSHYQPPRGRMNLLKGEQGSFIIDDTYNSSPAASEEALKALALFPAQGRRVAVLADMLELGRYSAHEHETIGRLASGIVDLLVVVGTRARAIAEGALAEGFAESKIIYTDSSREAAARAREWLSAGDTILVKGSQSMRMERVVETLLAKKADAHLLVRQEREWKRRV